MSLWFPLSGCATTAAEAFSTFKMLKASSHQHHDLDVVPYPSTYGVSFQEAVFKGTYALVTSCRNQLSGNALETFAFIGAAMSRCASTLRRAALFLSVSPSRWIFTLSPFARGTFAQGN